jgi:hypothetical protein
LGPLLLACDPSATYGDDDDVSSGNSHGGNLATGGVGGAGAESGRPVATGGQSVHVGGTSGVGGRGQDVPLPDADDDGIPDDDEIAVGTDPRIADTDGDGCDDLLEATFGECDTETMASVHSCDGEAHLALTMAPGTGERMNDLVAQIVPLSGGFAEDLWPRVSEVTPADAGDFAGDGTLLSVDPGARVAYRVVPFVVFRWQGIRTYVLRVSSSAGGVLAEGKIVWRRSVCPYVE